MKKSLKSIYIVLSEWSLATWTQMFIVFALCGIGVYAYADLMSGI